jgi:uncharacterized protein YjiS (DUF1127 family)
MFTTQNTTCVSPSRPRRGLGSLLAAIPRALALRQQRNRLAALDARMLKDIGVTPRMAEDEAARPVWDAPQHWRR